VIEALFPVGHVLGRLLLLFAVSYAGPIAASLAFGDGLAGDFAVGAVLTVGTGVLLMFATRRHHRELKARDGFLLVTFAWLLMAAMASLPIMIVYTDMSFTDAFFEAMSAMTTTGATVINGLDHAPQSINLWRHLLQWLGGLGFIVLAVAILPLLGVGGMQLYRAEMPGPMKESKFTARIKDTAKALWLVYVGLTLACMLSLRVAGMGWFDAICHGFSTIALGGFSTRDASIGAFDSVAIEVVMTAFTVLAGINFATHFLAFRGRSLRGYVADFEARAYLTLLAAAVLSITLYLHLHGTYADFGTTLRHAAFNVVSIANGSGFATVDYSAWPVFAPIAMLFLSGITVCSGSTGSGIKMVRTLILYNQAIRELHRMLHPSAAETIKIGRVVVPNKIAFSVLGFIFLYLATMTGVTFVFLASGMDLTHALGAAVSSLNNLGPGLGSVGPAGNYSGLTDFQKWTYTAAMLLGRLEIMSVLVLFTRPFWRK
jgi:trk system potassium uptake protein TrkH